MNTGKKFKKFNINKNIYNGWHMPVDIDNDSIYEFLTFHTKVDPQTSRVLLKLIIQDLITIMMMMVLLIL